MNKQRAKMKKAPVLNRSQNNLTPFSHKW